MSSNITTNLQTSKHINKMADEMYLSEKSRGEKNYSSLKDEKRKRQGKCYGSDECMIIYPKGTRGVNVSYFDPETGDTEAFVVPLKQEGFMPEKITSLSTYDAKTGNQKSSKKALINEIPKKDMQYKTSKCIGKTPTQHRCNRGCNKGNWQGCIDCASGICNRVSKTAEIRAQVRTYPDEMDY